MAKHKVASWSVVLLLTAACASPAPIGHGADAGSADADGGSADADGGSADADGAPPDGGSDASTAADGCGCDSGRDAGIDLDGGVDLDAGIDLDGGGDLDGGSSPDGGDTTVLGRQVLEDIAAAYRAFYAAELRWPKGDGYWDPRTSDVTSTSVGSVDTALFSAPAGLPACSASSRGPCWHGPFLDAGSSLGLDPWLDPWGHPIRYALIAVGSSVAAPQGAVVLWSLGPDGVDELGCTTPALNPACVIDPEKLAQGLTGATSDDVAVVIAPAYDPVTSTELLVAEVARSFRAFHEDTGVWPFANCSWDPVGGASPQIEPFPFTPGDSALATSPDPSMCSAQTGFPPTTGWGGPYLWSDVSNLGEGATLDGWGNPLMFALIRPFGDGNGGGVTSAPNGAILVWSTGPDGIDQLGCSTGTCTEGLDYNLLVQGIPSSLPSDDVIVFVDSAVAPSP